MNPTETSLRISDLLERARLSETQGDLERAREYAAIAFELRCAERTREESASRA